MQNSTMIGHNNPPSDEELLRQKLIQNNTQLFERAKELNSASQRVPKQVVNDAIAGKLADFIKQVGVCSRALEEARKSEKKPFLDMGTAVDATFREAQELLLFAKTMAEKPLAEYTFKKQEEERKKAQELAEKQRKEADEKLKKEEELRKAGLDEQADAAKKQAEKAQGRAEKAQVSADTGKGLGASRGSQASVSVREVWIGKVTDRNKLDLEKLRPYFTDDALQAAINKFIGDQGRELTGAEIKKEKRAVTR